MKIIYQLFIILLFTFIGELLHTYLLPTIPGSIIGLLLLLLALFLKVIKVEHVNDMALWLQKNMAFLFIPLCVGIMQNFDILKLKWFEFILITVVSTVGTLILTALIASKGDKHE